MAAPGLVPESWPVQSLCAVCAVVLVLALQLAGTLRRSATFGTGVVLGEEGKKALQQYKYVAGGATPLDNVMNTAWWNPVATLLPRWLAPNLITVTGTIGVCLTTALLVSKSPTFSESTTPAVYILAAVGIFLYQTLDAIDGKQARATGTSSPLGQICDHGCDSLASSLVLCCTFVAMQVGFPLAMLGLCIANSTFFLANWEELWTGILRTSVGPVGVTEGQLQAVVMLLVCAAFGGDCFARWTLWGVEIRFIIMGQFIFGTLFIALNAIWNTMVKTRGKADAVKDLAPLVLVNAAAVLAVRELPVGALPVARVITIGNLFSYISCRMILAAVVHMKFPHRKSCFVAYPVLLVMGVEHLAFTVGGYALDIYQQQLNYMVLDVFLFLLTLLSLLFWVSKAAGELCSALDIQLFRIPCKKD
eukprot:gb/GFBE01052072.1/.p1 GENE.gb/GFBE01052072.1/~~gb/GFBE01052072.1/.p1  ORF type:complete len:419 (+),score=72.76 gb/GFBE01052072.1/:1-1257(+)